MIWHLDLRDKNVGGCVLPGRLVYPAGISDDAATTDQLALHRHIVFVIHGFNVNRLSGQQQTFNFAHELRLDPNAPLGPPAYVGVTWPGDSWAGPASYPFEANDADDSGFELARFIEWAVPAGTTLSFITHSMGARVAFECITRLPKGVYPIDQVCVMAAAVDDFSVSETYVYRKQVEAAKRVAVLASERDNVLRWAYPLGDTIQSFFFFWKDIPGAALGYHGPRASYDEKVPANVEHVQIPTHCGVDHSDYLWNEPGKPSELEKRALAFARQAMSGVKPLGY